MKKTMKMMLSFVAGALALSACSNEDILNENVNENGPKLVTLTAYQEGEDASRAAIDGTTSTQIDWSENDQINYFGDGTGESMTLSTGAGTATGTFSGKVTTGANDYVLYPYQASATCATGVITAEFPMTQYAVVGSFDPKTALMVGAVNAGSVEFKNVMSYVKVTIPSTMTNCKQVVLKAKDAWTTVAGKVNITASTGAWAETSDKEGQAFVRLVPQDGDYLTAGASYYIAILPQTMTNGFELIFNDNDVIKVKQSASVTSPTNSVEFGRSKTKKLGAISDFTYTVSTIDLTAPSGVSYTSLKMADRNIGAATTGSTDYGDYFSWGALRPAYTKKPSSGIFLTDLYWSFGFTEDNTPSSFTDIAAMLWGGKWRMPSKDECSANIENSSVIALPRGGYYNSTLIWDDVTDNNNYGYYRSSTPNGGEVWYLHIYDYNWSVVYSSYRYYGYSVRPVLAQ